MVLGDSTLVSMGTVHGAFGSWWCCLFDGVQQNWGCVKVVPWVLGGHVTKERREGGQRWCAVQWCARCLWYFAPWGVEMLQVDQYANTQHKYTIEDPGGSSSVVLARSRRGCSTGYLKKKTHLPCIVFDDVVLPVPLLIVHLVLSPRTLSLSNNFCKLF